MVSFKVNCKQMIFCVNIINKRSFNNFDKLCFFKPQSLYLR